MSGSIVLEVRRDEAASMRRVVERVRANRVQGVSAAEVRRVVEGALQYPGRLRVLLDQELRRVFEEPEPTVAGLRAAREILEEIADSYLAFAELARDLVATAAGTPTPNAWVGALSNLEGAIGEIQALRREIAEQWPVASKAEMAEDMAAIARGEAVPVEDAFAEMAGISKEALRQRLEEHKRRRRELGLE